MLRIWGRKTSSNVQKVLWCCGELGLGFEREDAGREFGKNRTAAYLALNPNGLVPTIEEDGFVLWESNAIVRYLAAKYGSGGLWPADPRVAASASRWMDWQLSVLHPSTTTLFRALRRGSLTPLPPAEIKAAEKRAGDTWAILDAQLGKTAYVACAELTVGDIAFCTAIHRWFSLPLTRPELPRLRAYYDRLCARPAYREHILGG